MVRISRKHEELLDQLVGLAGSPLLVQDVLRALNEELGRAPRLDEVVRRILIEQERQESEAVAVPSR
ncbi:MAG: hypothetical protein ACYC3Q_15790 [Gemmatimonadaceae bacterium]